MLKKPADVAPYRDDRARLEAEVERLRAEVAPLRRRRHRVGLIVVALLVHLSLRGLLARFLNGASDVGFWLAAIAAFAPLVFAVCAPLYWLLERNRNEPTP